MLTAWEAAALWRDWAEHLGTVDPDGMARFHPHREPDLLHDRDTTARRSWRCGTRSGIPYERFDSAALQERFPGLDIGRYYPPKRIDDPAFADDATSELTAFYNADSGFIDDPMLAAHNLANAAAGQRCRVPVPARSSPRSTAPRGRVTRRDVGRRANTSPRRSWSMSAARTRR